MIPAILVLATLGPADSLEARVARLEEWKSGRMIASREVGDALNSISDKLDRQNEYMAKLREALAGVDSEQVQKNEDDIEDLQKVVWGSAGVLALLQLVLAAWLKRIFGPALRGTEAKHE